MLVDKGSLTVRLQDPFNMMKSGFEQADGRVVQSSLRRFGMRGVYLNFSYNYGQAPRVRPRPHGSCSSAVPAACCATPLRGNKRNPRPLCPTATRDRPLKART